MTSDAAANRVPLNFVATILDESIPPTDPLWIRLIRHDGSVQAEVMVAAGYRLVADADGVRAENFVERWLTDHQAGPPCP